jgi:hypothetical protein
MVAVGSLFSEGLMCDVDAGDGRCDAVVWFFWRCGEPTYRDVFQQTSEDGRLAPSKVSANEARDKTASLFTRP